MRQTRQGHVDPTTNEKSQAGRRWSRAVRSKRRFNSLDSGPFTKQLTRKDNGNKTMRRQGTTSVSLLLERWGTEETKLQTPDDKTSRHASTYKNQTKQESQAKASQRHYISNPKIREGEVLAEQPKWGRDGKGRAAWGERLNGSDALQIRRELRVEPDPDPTTTESQIYNIFRASWTRTTNHRLANTPGKSKTHPTTV